MLSNDTLGRVMRQLGSWAVLNNKKVEVWITKDKVEFKFERFTAKEYDGYKSSQRTLQEILDEYLKDTPFAAWIGVSTEGGISEPLVDSYLVSIEEYEPYHGCNDD